MSLVQEGCHLKIILFLSLIATFFNGSHLCNCDRDLFEEHFCELILNLEKISFKYVSILALMASLFSGAQPFLQLW